MSSKRSTFWATIWYEGKMGWRQPAWWAWMMLCLGIGWLSIDKGKLPWTTVWKLSLTPANALAVWGSILLPIFAVRIYLREISGHYEWYWVQLEDERVELISKFLATYIHMCLGLIPAYLYTAYFLAKYYGIYGLVLQSKLWSVLILPSFGASLAITMVLSLMIRSVFLSILGALIIVGGLVFADLDTTHLFALAPTTVPYSATTDLEPSRSLFYLNRTFWFLVAVSFLCFSLNLIRHVQPRITQPSNIFWRFGFAFLMGILLITVAGTCWVFQGEHQRVFYQSQLPPTSIEMPSCEWLEQYDVNLMVDTASRIVSGTVHLRINVPEVSTPYYLTPGLSWVTSSNTTTSKIHIDDERSTLFFDTNGNNQTYFTLDYQGWPRVPKEFVECRSCFNNPEYHRYPLLDDWYLDSKGIFLSRDGGWHPFPGCTPDNFTLSFKNISCQVESCLVHTANEIIPHSNLLRATWRQVPAGPLFAATPHYITQEVENVTAYMPVGLAPENLYENLIYPYALTLSRIKEFRLLNTHTDHLKIAITPFFRYPRFSDRGVLFVPERALLSRAISSKEIFTQFAAEQVVKAWWCSGAVCPDIMQTNPYDFPVLPTANHSRYYATVRETLMQYTTLRLLAPDIPSMEIDSKEFIGSDIELMQRLDLLYKQSQADYWQLVYQYRQVYGTANTSKREFEDFVEDVIGRPLP